MSIFDKLKEVQTGYWKQVTVGDRIEGTYIDKRIGTNRLKNNENQNIYTILQEDGSVIDVYGKPGIDKQMIAVSLGQMIRMEYIKEEPSKVAGHSATKVIQVSADKNVVNKEWLESVKNVTTESAEEGVDDGWPDERPNDTHGGAGDLGPALTPDAPKNTLPQTQTPDPVKSSNQVQFFSGSETATTTPASTTDVLADPLSMSVEDVVAEINKIAVDKLNAVGGEQDVKDKVMEKTGLAFISSNLPNILVSLRAL